MRRSIFCVVAASALAVACGDGKGNEIVPPPPEPGLALDALCTELVAADCTRLTQCGALVPPFDRARCIERQTARCAPWGAAVKAAAEANELTYFELTAKKCRDRIAALSCEVNIDYDYLREPDCAAMFTALRNEGETCSLPASCNDGFFCDGRSTCPGTCKKYKTNNEPCSLNDPCANGFFCAVPVMRCHAKVALGAPCEISIGGNSCVDGTFCDVQPLGNTCAPVRGRGTGCQNDFECVAGTRCISNLCSAGVENDRCASNADCNGGLRCAQSRCKAPVEEGVACMPELPCREGFGCFTTCSTCALVCNPRPEDGDRCNASAEGRCYFSRCETPAMPTMDPVFCGPQRDDGAACALASDCKIGRVCEMGVCTVPAVDCSAI